ncbi:hypothetical protein V5O48_001893 [Marasmius crinis-equi]|uniref:Uncharacterized protein n=1 Tax=Marasmius crinis-equi TaxID=585013 RepID=A0ABR3FX50_9AGAR
MVRIFATVLGALVALSTVSLASIEELGQNVDVLRGTYFPALNESIAKVPDSPAELQLCDLIALPTNLSWIDSGRVLCAFRQAHHDLMELVNAVKAKNGSFTGDKAYLRAPLRAQISDMRVGHDKLTKDFVDRCNKDLKEEAEALNKDGDQQFAVIESSFDPLS